MKNTILSILILWAACCPALVNAQDFVRHLPIGHATVTLAAPSSDGGMFTYFGEHPQRVLAKLDEAGGLAWSLSVPNVSGIIPDQNGGIIVVRHTDGMALPPDSAYDPMLMQWLNADGDMTRSKRSRTPLNEGLTRWEIVHGQAFTPSGELYVLMSASNEDGWLFKFDPQGELLWTRWLGYGLHWARNIALLPDGGVLTFHFDDSYEDLGFVVLVSAAGEMLWTRQLLIDAPALAVGSSSILVDSDGSLVMAFTSSNSHDWVVFGKMTQDGDMIWAQAYRVPLSEGMQDLGHMHLHAPARVLPNGNYFFGSTKGGFEITPQGDLVSERQCTTPTLADGFESIAHLLNGRVTADGWMLDGRRTWTDPLFGHTLQLPLFGRIPLDLDSSCLLYCSERSDHTAVPIPLDLFQAVSHPTVHWPFTYTAETWPLETFEDVTMALLEDACELPEIVEFTTSVFDLVPDQGLMIYPNPVVAGQFISVDTQVPLVLDVFDAGGRVVYSQLHSSQPVAINTSDWDAGIYLMRAHRPDGRSPVTRYLVVQ